MSCFECLCNVCPSCAIVPDDVFCSTSCLEDSVYDRLYECSICSDTDVRGSDVTVCVTCCSECIDGPQE